MSRSTRSRASPPSAPSRSRSASAARETARALNAGRFVRNAFELGQTISIGELRGRIIAIESDATVLGTNDGAVRVPNNVLIESIVKVHGQTPERG